MRVGLLIYGSLETISGGYLYDRKLVSYLQSQGDQVEIISLPWRNYPRHLLDNLSSDLLRRLNDLSVDVLIQDELNHPSLAWLNGKFKPPYPILSLVHHLRSEELRPVWQNRFYRWIERHYLNRVDGFIFNSQTTHHSAGCVSQIGIRPWVIATPAGDRFQPAIRSIEIENRSNQPGALRLIFLGNLIQRKGLHTLMDALTRLPEGCCTLEVVGNSQADPGYTRKIEQQIETLALQNRVKFHGTLGDHALANLLRNSQVLVVPASYEGFGIVYLEGMGYGLPAIGTTQGAAREIIVPGENGDLINPGDAATLATLLQGWQKEREKLTTLSLAARRRYEQFPGWGQSMARVREFLVKII